ncbi:MAG: helix-turn-helix domain-containing protein [Deltaproteobacteria bacterium]|nr:helix-turn-helix domain-containing protein [Deltaproteobacteria bacterium]
MAKVRTYSRYSTEAASLLGKQIRLGRKERKWAEQDLADRAGISRYTVQKIEKGDLTCAIGLVFEVAALVGVKLFDGESSSLSTHLERADDKLSLLPKTIHKSKKPVDDDF